MEIPAPSEPHWLCTGTETTSGGKEDCLGLEGEHSPTLSSVLFLSLRLLLPKTELDPIKSSLSGHLGNQTLCLLWQPSVCWSP